VNVNSYHDCIAKGCVCWCSPHGGVLIVSCSTAGVCSRYGKQAWLKDAIPSVAPQGLGARVACPDLSFFSFFCACAYARFLAELASHPAVLHLAGHLALWFLPALLAPLGYWFSPDQSSSSQRSPCTEPHSRSAASSATDRIGHCGQLQRDGENWPNLVMMRLKLLKNFVKPLLEKKL
jgi:hypothetical protein